MKKLVGAVFGVGFIGLGIYFFPFILDFFRTPYPETIFPEDTMAYLTLRSVTEARENLPKTLLWQQIEKSPRKKIYERQKQHVFSFLESMTGVNPQPFLDEFTKDVAFGVFPLRTGSPSGAFVGYIEDEENFQRLLEQRLDPELKRRIPDLKKTGVKDQGITYYKYSTERLKGKLYPVYCIIDHRFIFSYSEEGLKHLLDVKKGKQKPLKNSRLFQNAKKETGYKHGLLFYLNAQSALKAIETSIKDTEKLWPAIVRVTGIDAVQSFGYGVTLKNEGFSETGFLSVGAQRQGLLKIYFEQPPQEIAAISAIPAGSKVFSAGTLADFAKMWDEINSQLSTILTPSQYEKWEKGMNFMKGFLNFDVRRDLLEPLGDQFCFSYEAVNPGEADPSKMKYLFILKLRKPDQFKGTLDRLVSLAAWRGIEKKQENYKGKNVEILEIGMGEVSLSPAYFLEDSWFYFSTHSEMLKKSIDTQITKSGIGHTPDYKKVTSGFPSKVNGISYTNVQAYLQMYASILEHQSENSDRVWIREYGVQDELEYLAKNLFGSASYTLIQDGGMYIHSYSSVPASFLALPIIISYLPQIMEEIETSGLGYDAQTQ